jgi:hypothetical protein
MSIDPFHNLTVYHDRHRQMSPFSRMISRLPSRAEPVVVVDLPANMQYVSVT